MSQNSSSGSDEDLDHLLNALLEPYLTAKLTDQLDHLSVGSGAPTTSAAAPGLSIVTAGGATAIPVPVAPAPIPPVATGQLPHVAPV